MAVIWLAHIDAFNPATELVETLYFSSSSYVTGSTNLPPNGVANTYYDPRVQQPALLRQEMFTSRKTYGKSQTSFGLLELVNTDGGLDFLHDYGFDDRHIQIILGEVQPGSAPVWTTIMSGTLEQIELSWDKVTFPIFDKQKKFEKTITQIEYAGTNSLPNGLEGTAEDLKGKPKPRLFGKVFHISPPIVNTAKLIYQINNGAIYDVPAAFDSGLALTRGTDYTSESDMFNNDPAPGYYRAWLGGGYVRLGMTPTNVFTCHAVEKASDADMTVAQIIKRILLNDSILTSGEISSADITAADTANSSVVGIWVNDKSAYNSVFDSLANSIRLWYSFDSLGIFRVGIVSPITDVSQFTITKSDIIRFNRVPSNNEGRGLPCYKVQINYAKYFTVQTTGLADGVTEAVKSELSKEYRSETVSDTSIQVKHPLAPDLVFDTLLVDAADAAALATEALTIYKMEAAFYEIRCLLEGPLFSSIELGDTITIEYDRLGLNGSKDLIITAIKPNSQLRLLDLTVWG